MKQLVIAAALVTAFILAVVSTATASTNPSKFGFGAGGVFSNPCNGDPVSYFVTGTGLIVSSEGSFLVKEHGTGTGSDGATGETFDVTFDLKGTSATDGSGSFTGHVVVVFVGRRTGATFVFHSVANVNFRPSQPQIVDFQFVTCAGVGMKSL